MSGVATGAWDVWTFVDPAECRHDWQPNRWGVSTVDLCCVRCRTRKPAPVGRDRILAGLGRPERDIDLGGPLARLGQQRILVTGAAGAVGRPFVEALEASRAVVVATDLGELDITNRNDVHRLVASSRADLVVNFAAAKLAVKGEEEPWETLNTSVNGVQNLVSTGCRVVQASTCKAADPFCVYGAGKMAAERLVLNAGGTVFRFVNIPEAGPSMLTEWAALPSGPVPVTDCSRYVITLKEATALAVWACVLPSGRYKLDAGAPVPMHVYARRVFPSRTQTVMPLRRGDRPIEPLHAAGERLEETSVPFIQRIVSPND